MLEMSPIDRLLDWHVHTQEQYMALLGEQSRRTGRIMVRRDAYEAKGDGRFCTDALRHAVAMLQHSHAMTRDCALSRGLNPCRPLCWQGTWWRR
jgi:hypothetical protein